MICCFLGYRETPDSISDTLRKTIVNLIENHFVDTFYVGNNGNFDKLVHQQLKILQSVYPHMKYYVVLAYRPSVKDVMEENCEDSIYPPCLCRSTNRSAIPMRNKWMIDMSDIIVCYVTHNGNSRRFVGIAKTQHKKIINIANETS